MEGAAVVESDLHPDFGSSGSAWFVDWSHAASQPACSGSGVLEAINVEKIRLIRNSFLRGREKMEMHRRTSLSKIGFSLRSN